MNVFPRLAYFLTHDETLSLVSRRRMRDFRLRVWHARGRPPVALVEPVAGGEGPDLHAARIATCLSAAYFGGSDAFYFLVRDREGRIAEVHTTRIGPRVLGRPTFQARARATVEGWLGGPIDPPEDTP